MARQATEIQLLKNDKEFSDDKVIADKVIEQYDFMKSELEP